MSVKMSDVPPVQKTPAHLEYKYQTLKEAFLTKYGKAPAFYARAPGRVNLIGEHIDYCGYAVLPMALDQDIVIAAAPNDMKQLRMSNTNSLYSEYSCTTSEINIDRSKPQWQHYFLCGYRGILEHFGLAASVGIDLILAGVIPKSAGLSSSSALVCCAALVTMKINGLQLSKLELSELCQNCEHYIGTQGGGMDQAISFLAQPGTAKLIEFNPIRTKDIHMPDGAAFVISNSCVEMNKAATSSFNIRVSECRLAAQVMAKQKGLDWQQVKTLGPLQDKLGLSLGDMMQLVSISLHKEPYTKQEICDILNVTNEQLNQISLSEKVLTVDSFKLHQRAHHVYSEANRVWQFKAVCDEQSIGGLEQLGQLMTDSHYSCRDMYECSHPQLDSLVDLCLKSGALGSRLTGAGWGGCAVSLVPASQVETFKEKVLQGFFNTDPERAARAQECLFSTQPAGGACFYAE